MVPSQTMFFRSPSSGMQGVRDQLWLSRQMRRIGREIGRYGWSAAPLQLPYDRAPRCIHTVGFDESLNRPELIIFDTPPEIAFQELSFAFQAWSRDQLEIKDGSTWFKDAGEVRCVVRKVDPSQVSSWFGLAAERRRRITGDSSGLAAFQLVLADRAGFLPWEPCYDESAGMWQPALYEPEADAAMASGSAPT